MLGRSEPPWLWRRTRLLLGPEVRVFVGAAPLAIAFWHYGVAMSLVLAAAGGAAAATGRELLGLLLGALFVAHTAWSLVGIWRCAGSATPLWCTLARLITIAWGANVVLLTMFLLLELWLGTYLAGSG